MKQILKRLYSPPAAAAIAAAVIMLIALFIFPRGMADNGDFYRVTNGNGIYKLDRDKNDQYSEYFSTKYGVYLYFSEYESSLINSQTPFIKAALALDRLFTGEDGIFDIRFLSALIGIWSLAAIYLLVEYASWGLKRRYGYYVAALAVLIFADTGYTAYFNSFYAESLVFVSFLTAMACALLIFQGRRKRGLLLAAYIFSSLVLISAKQQNAPLGFILGLLIIPMIMSMPKKRPWPPHSEVRRVAATCVCSFLLIGCGLLVYFVIPQEYVDINKYHAMTRGILMTADNPEDPLAFFGINKQYSLLDGTTYYERYPDTDVEGDDMKASFYPQYGFVSIMVYYAEHPGSFMSMLDIAAKDAYSIRPASIGNFERGAGKEPGQQTYFFTLYSYLKERFFPRTFGFIIIWIIAVLGIGVQDRKRTLVTACAIIMGLSQIVVSIIGAGDADLSKHIFLFNLAFDFSNFTLISTVGFAWRANRKKSTVTKKTLNDSPGPLKVAGK